VTEWPECPGELAKQLRQSPLPWKQQEDGRCKLAMPLTEAALEAGAAAHGEASDDPGAVSCVSSSRQGRPSGGGGRGKEEVDASSSRAAIDGQGKDTRRVGDAGAAVEEAAVTGLERGERRTIRPLTAGSELRRASIRAAASAASAGAAGIRRGGASRRNSPTPRSAEALTQPAATGRAEEAGVAGAGGGVPALQQQARKEVPAGSWIRLGRQKRSSNGADRSVGGAPAPAADGVARAPSARVHTARRSAFRYV
jgi:hypothetical protein